MFGCFIFFQAFVCLAAALALVPAQARDIRDLIAEAEREGNYPPSLLIGLNYAA